MTIKEGFKIKDFYKTEVRAGKRSPFVGKTLGILDKSLLLFNQGNHSMICKK